MVDSADNAFASVYSICDVWTKINRICNRGDDKQRIKRGVNARSDDNDNYTVAHAFPNNINNLILCPFIIIR